MGDQWKWIEMAIRSMWWISKQGLLTSASRLICYHSEVWLWSHAALCGFVLPDHDVRALPWWHSSLKRPFWTEKLDFSKKIRLIKKIRIKNRFTKKTTQQEESAEKQKRTTKTGNNPGVQLCCKLSTWILPSCCFGFCYFMLLFLVFVYSYFFWMAFCFIFFWLFFFCIEPKKISCCWTLNSGPLGRILAAIDHRDGAQNYVYDFSNLPGTTFQHLTYNFNLVEWLPFFRLIPFGHVGTESSLSWSDRLHPLGKQLVWFFTTETDTADTQKGSYFRAGFRSSCRCWMLCGMLQWRRCGFSFRLPEITLSNLRLTYSSFRMFFYMPHLSMGFICFRNRVTNSRRNGYGSIPIHTIFSGMNIHKSQLFWCELQGYQGFDPSPNPQPRQEVDERNAKLLQTLSEATDMLAKADEMQVRSLAEVQL